MPPAAARVDDEEPFSAGRNESIAGVERCGQGMESTEESTVEYSIVTVKERSGGG